MSAEDMKTDPPINRFGQRLNDDYLAPACEITGEHGCYSNACCCACHQSPIAKKLDAHGITPVYTEDKIDGSDVATITLAEAGILLDALEAAEDRPQCRAVCSHGGSCSRDEGHGGSHESRNGDEVFCSWGEVTA